MGTTLTGTTPQDTYDSLIKVTDNGPLSGTAKYLSDGLGNDSALALSTTSVGIGTATPDQKLNIVGSQTTAYATSSGSEVIPLGGVNMTMQNTGTGGFTSMRFVSLNGSNAIGYLGFTNTTSSIGGAFVFGQRSGGGYAEQVRIDASGNVGIGTSAPTRQLSISATNPQMVLKSTTTTGFSELYFGDSAADNGFIGYAHNGDYMYFGTNNAERVRILSGGGITFNGDTAAANALDDYEEGTFTPVFTMGTSGTIVTGGVSGRYTKVGNLVTCTGFANVSSVLLPVGELRIGGLPFTTGTASDSGMSIFAYGFANITAVSTYQGFISAGLTYAIVRGFSNGDQVQNIGANVVASAGMIFTITYRV